MAATTETIKTIEMGAPSKSGIDCNDLVSKNFVASDFPLKIKVTNCVGYRRFIHGIDLPPSHDIENCTKEAVIQSIDEMQRLASDVEAIAEVNGHALLVKIEFTKAESVPVETVEAIGDVEPPVETSGVKTKK